MLQKAFLFDLIYAFIYSSLGNQLCHLPESQVSLFKDSFLTL